MEPKNIILPVHQVRRVVPHARCSRDRPGLGAEEYWPGLRPWPLPAPVHRPGTWPAPTRSRPA